MPEACVLHAAAPVSPSHVQAPPGRSRYQRSEFLHTSEFPKELPTHTAECKRLGAPVEGVGVRERGGGGAGSKRESEGGREEGSDELHE